MDKSNKWEKLINETQDGYKIWETNETISVDNFTKEMFSIKNFTPNFRCYLMQFPTGNKEYVLYSFSRIPLFTSETVDGIKEKVEELYLQIC